MGETAFTILALLCIHQYYMNRNKKALIIRIDKI